MAKATKLQREISNIRKALRTRMVILAKGHRGCTQARGCGCYTDKTITVLERTEQELFGIELEAYADTKDKPQPHYLEERKDWESDSPISSLSGGGL